MVRSLSLMPEAQRLVQVRRLADATALIQERLGGRSSPGTGTPAAFNGPTIELTVVATGPARDAPRTASPILRSRPRFAARASAPSAWAAAPDLTIPTGAEFLHFAHEGSKGRRAFRLYVPAAQRTEKRPLLVMLHGCTQNPEVFATGTRMNRVAEEAGLLVAYPEQDRSANPNLCWNWFEPAHQKAGAGEPAILAAIVEDIARSHTVDRDRIYVAGLSAGGAMAAVLASTRPDLFAAVGIHSGLPYASASTVATALSVMRSGKVAGNSGIPNVPAIIFHGARDTTVHPANGERIAGIDADSRGTHDVTTGTVNNRTFTRTNLPARAGRPAREHWRIEGLGHAWSGGDAAGSYADPAGPDASREMLRFFLEHRTVPHG